MEDNIQILKSAEVLGKSFTIYGTKEEPLFRAKEVAEIIEHTNITKMLELVDEDEKGVKELLTPGGVQQVMFLTEDGLYEVMMQSRKPIAKQFKKGVKAILKEIRLNGGYIATNTEESDEEIMAKALVVAQATINRKNQRIKALQNENNEQAKLITSQATEIVAYKQRQSYLDVIMRSKETVKTRLIAQDYGLTANALNKKLHELGIQYKEGDTWTLYKKYLPMGYMQSVPFEIKRKDGAPGIRFHPQWTQQGRMFIYNTLKENGVLPLIERCL